MRKSYLAGIVATICLAVIGIGQVIVEAFDRSLRWLFAASPYQPRALALEGVGGFLDPQPGNQPISAQLYQRNRHEAHSHSRAAYRAI
jgi:hypothetical protein